MSEVLAPGIASSLQIKLPSRAAIDPCVPVDYHIHTTHTDETANG